jgi:hypothetical protein
MARGDHGFPSLAQARHTLLPAVLGVARSQGQWPVAVFCPLGHPTPYAYASLLFLSGNFLVTLVSVKNDYY